MKPNFSTMTKSDLRAYVIAYPDDRTAFQFKTRCPGGTSIRLMFNSI
ncbi:DUF6887 family protein [Calothrix sp. 336/3]